MRRSQGWRERSASLRTSPRKGAPILAAEFRALPQPALERVVDDGATVIISSHVLRDVESVVDRVAMLDGGRIVCHEDLDDLKERYGASDGGALDLEGLFPRVLADAKAAGGFLR